MTFLFSIVLALCTFSSFLNGAATESAPLKINTASQFLTTLLPGLGDTVKLIEKEIHTQASADQKHALAQLVAIIDTLPQEAPLNKKTVKHVDTLIKTMRAASPAEHFQSLVTHLESQVTAASKLLAIVKKTAAFHQWFYNQRQSHVTERSDSESTILLPYLVTLTEKTKTNLEGRLTPNEMTFLDEILNALKAPLESLRYRKATITLHQLKNKIAHRNQTTKEGKKEAQEAISIIDILHEDLVNAVNTIEAFHSLFVSHHDNTPTFKSILNYEQGLTPSINPQQTPLTPHSSLALLFPNTEMEKGFIERCVAMFVEDPFILKLFNKELTELLYSSQLPKNQKYSLKVVMLAQKALKKCRVSPEYKSDLKSAIKQVNRYIDVLKQAVKAHAEITKSKKLQWVLKKNNYAKEGVTPRVITMNYLFPQLMVFLNDAVTALDEFMGETEKAYYINCIKYLKCSVGTMQHRRMYASLDALKTSIQKAPSLKAEQTAKKNRLKLLDTFKDLFMSAQILLEGKVNLFVPFDDERFNGMRALLALESEYRDILYNGIIVVPGGTGAALIAVAIREARIAAYKKKLEQIVLERVSLDAFED